MNPVLINGMHGLGDNVYQYPIIQDIAKHRKVYLRTPWPEVYKGLDNVEFCRPETRLRTQSKNVNSYTQWATPPHGIAVCRMTYVDFKTQHVPYYRGLMYSLSMNFPYHLSIRPRGDVPRPYAVIRPATLRTEWLSPARNPRQEYIQFAIDYLNGEGVATVVVADIDPPNEIYDGFRPERASVYYEHGEIKTPELMEMIANAQIVVGAVGFIVPMGIAFGTPTVILHGGSGALNGPQMIDCPGQGKLTHVLPEQYCHCAHTAHNCNKRIQISKIADALRKLL